jgi:Yeast cell wall synthesis protein KRE9/KNH1
MVLMCAICTWPPDPRQSLIIPQIPLKTLVPTGQFATGNTASSSVEVGLGASVENAYFIKMISAAQGGSVVNFSPRFSISGMTGKFPASVTAGLATVAGTEGPATQNNIQSNQQGGGNAPGVGGDFGVTYTAQTGTMRFAPMPKVPPSKISAGKNPKPLYPTSAVQFAKTVMPIPMQKTTVTQSFTFSVASSENTVSGPSRSI